MPVEWVLLLFGALVGGLYHYFDLPMPGEPGGQAKEGPLLFYIKQILTAADLYCLVLLLYVALQLVRLIVRHRFRLKDLPWRPFWRHLSTRFYGEQLFQDARFMNALLIMFVEFALLKNLIPVINSRVYDEWFFSVDKRLCGGATCSEFLHGMLGTSAPVLSFISENYFWYYPYMSLVALIFIVGAPRALAQQYMCTFVLLFMFGTVSIYAAPTWGPIYYKPQLFEFMRDSEIYRLQESLWAMKMVLESHPGSREAIFMISGFPSLHVAVVMTGTLYLRRLHWALAALSAIFLLLTLNSTMYLGWHYLGDDIGAILLVYLAHAVSKQIAWSWRGLCDWSPTAQ
jgi:membrane-associated phospholipid phosphatase